MKIIQFEKKIDLYGHRPIGLIFVMLIFIQFGMYIMNMKSLTA